MHCSKRSFINHDKEYNKCKIRIKDICNFTVISMKPMLNEDLYNIQEDFEFPLSMWDFRLNYTNKKLGYYIYRWKVELKL